MDCGDQCSVCQQYLDDLDEVEKVKHINFCNEILLTAPNVVAISIPSQKATAVKKTSKVAKPKAQPKPIVAVSTSTSSVINLVDENVSSSSFLVPKKPPQVRKMSKNKLEQELQKFSVEEQRQFLESMLQTLKKPTVELEKNTQMSLSSYSIPQKVETQLISNTVSSSSALSKYESELFSLRTELGDIINTESELRIREKKVRNNIKKLCKKITYYEDQSKHGNGRSEVKSEEYVRNFLFPANRYILSDVTKQVNNTDWMLTRPLWELSKICELFEVYGECRLFDENRDAVLPTEETYVVPREESTLSMIDVGSTSVVCTEFPFGNKVPSTSAIDLTSKLPSSNESKIMDLTCASQSPVKSIQDTSIPTNPESLKPVSLFSQIINAIDGPTQATQSNINASQLVVNDDVVDQLMSVLNEPIQFQDCVLEDSEVIPPTFEAFLNQTTHQDVLILLGTQHFKQTRLWIPNAVHSLQLSIAKYPTKYGAIYKQYIDKTNSLMKQILQLNSSSSCYQTVQSLVLQMLLSFVEYVSQCWYHQSTSSSVAPLDKSLLLTQMDNSIQLTSSGQKRPYATINSNNDTQSKKLQTPVKSHSQGYDANFPIELYSPSPDKVCNGSAIVERQISLSQRVTPEAESVVVNNEDNENSVDDAFNWENDYVYSDKDFIPYDDCHDFNNDNGVANREDTIRIPSTQVQPKENVVPANVAVVRRVSTASTDNDYSISANQSMDDVIAKFLVNESSYYDDIVSFVPIDIDRLHYEFCNATNLHLTKKALLEYLDKQGIFVSRYNNPTTHEEY